MNQLALTAVFAASICAAQTIAINPKTMARTGTVDERFQSYNVEMVEVTGGRFWAPYRTATAAAPETPAGGRAAVPGLDPNAFRMRQPIDLSHARLRNMAKALGPAYVRVSGTWANSTWFHNEDGPGPATPPSGYGGILTRNQWRGVVDFARATNAKIVTSFAISQGTRDGAGAWTPDQVQQLLTFTKSIGGSIAAAEFFNEPNIAAMGGAPRGYDAAAYGRDFRVFLPFIRKAAPEMLLLGPGSVAEGQGVGNFPMLRSEDLLRETSRGLDGVSYHFYGGVSKRCAAMSPQLQRSPETALDAAWLERTEQDRALFAGLRDRLAAGKPLWVTETAETACGGNPWAATFIDSFRYLNQLGRLAKGGVQVVAHNTLAASDYALIDEETMQPRPSYWAALLWRNLMGSTVLDAGSSPAPDVYLYAHCLRGRAGGVGLLAINASREKAATLTIPQPAQRYTLTAAELVGTQVKLNGKEMTLLPDGSVPAVAGQSTPAGAVSTPPASITFLAFPEAANGACR